MSNGNLQPVLDFSAFDKAVDKNKKPASSGQFDLSVFDNAVKKKDNGSVSTNGFEIPLVSLDKNPTNPQLELSQKNFSDYILNPASVIPQKITINSLDNIEKQQFIDQNGYFKPKAQQDILVQTIISERDNPVSKYNKAKLFLEQDMANNTKEDKFRDYILSPSAIIDKNVDDLKKDILDEGEPIVDGKIPSISYANARKSQIDQQIADLKSQQNFINNKSGVVRMDLATGQPQKTADYDELQGKINDLSAYRQQLINYTEPIAKVQVFRATKEKPVDLNDPASQIVNHWGDVVGTRTSEENKNREIGMNYTALFDPITVENKKKSLESGGDNIRNQDIVSIENYGYEKQGIITSVEALDILHSQGKIEDNVYESERGKLLQTNNQLINKYPVVRMQNIKGALGQILDSKRDAENSDPNPLTRTNTGGILKSLWENIVHAGYSDSEVQSAIDQLNAKGANITKKEAEFLINSKSDIGNTALLGRAIGGIANFENKLETTVGLQSEVDYENSKHILQQKFANTPNKATEQPQTIISTEGDIESNPNFMQPVKNPDAGLHNWGWGTVNLVADGVGTLAKLYALTELTGGLADELVGSTVGTEVIGATADARLGKIVQQTALSAGQRQTIGTIAGMYLDTYQDAKDAAKNFIGDEQGGEPAREMYANLMGLANGIAWTILPANKIVQDIAGKSASIGAEDFAKLIPNEGIAGLKENTVAEFVTNTLKNTAEAQGKMTGISALTQIGQYTAQAMYNPQSVESRNLGQEVVDGALQGLSFLPITLLEGRGIAKNIETVNDFTKEAIYRVSADPVAFKDYTNNQVAKGDITQQQANAKIELINTMFDIRTKDVPDDLTKQEKVEYANNLLFTRKLQDENKNIKDPVQTKKNDEKVTELEKRRQEILDNSTGKLPTQEAATTETKPADAVGPENKNVEPTVVHKNKYSLPKSEKGKYAIEEANSKKDEIEKAGFEFSENEDNPNPTPDTVDIGNVGLNWKNHNKGLGTLGYILKGEEYLKEGKHLVSIRPEHRSEQATSVWNKLARMGLAEQTSPGKYKYGGEREQPSKKGDANKPELLDNYEVNDVIIPDGIEKESNWQEKLVDKAFADMGLKPNKKTAGTGTIYYTFKDKAGEDVTIRLGDHSKGRWAGREVDGNAVYDKNSTPQNVLDILRDTLPDGKIVKSEQPSKGADVVDEVGIKLNVSEIKKWTKEYIGNPEHELHLVNVNELNKIRQDKNIEPQHPDAESVKSIKDEGLKTPLILLQDKEGNYQIQQGHHRLEEAEKLGAKKLPVVIVKSDELLKGDFGKIKLEKFPAKEQPSNKQEVDNKLSDENIGPDITVGELIDKAGIYKGQKGSFFQDGQSVVFKVEGKNKEYELGNIDEIKNTPIKDFGITHEQSVVSVNDEGGVKVRDTDYQNNFSDPLAAINKDKDGNIVSVNLETTDGKKRTFRGNIAEDIAYQINLKEINKNNETRSEFEQHINEDTEASKQMEDGRLSETTPTGTVENNDQVSREKIEPKYTVENFADRIAAGEKMTAPEDLQFYDNNKSEIEAALKEKAVSENKNVKPEQNISSQSNNNNESEKNNNQNGQQQGGGKDSNQQEGNAIPDSGNTQRQQGQEVVKDAVTENSGAASSQTPTEKVGKFEEKARKLAEKIMSAELPSWAKADLPEGTQVQGLDTGKIQKAIADATIKMGQLLDKGVEFGEAVKEAVKDLVDLLGEGMRGKIEEGFGKDYADKLADKNKVEKDIDTIDPELTNMANAINDAHIEGKFGVEALDKVISKLQDTDIKDIYEKVKEKIRKGVINVKNIRERLLTTREGSEQDQAALLYDLAELKGKENGLIKEIISEDNAEKKIELQRQLLDVQNEIQDNALANRFIGRTASNIFRLRQLWVNRGMDVVDMEEQYKASKGIKNLSEDQKKEIKIAHDQMRESRVKMESAKIELEKAKEENAKLKEENEKLKQLKDKATDQKKADRALKSKDAIDKSNERINKAKENLKSLSNNLSAGFDPRVAIEIGKMAAEKVYQGIVKFDELVKNVYDDIKDIFPDWAEADVARHILTTKDKNGNLIPSDTSERYLKSKLLVDDSNASLREKAKAYAIAQKDIALQQFNWQRDRRADILAKRPLKDRLIDFALRWQRFAVLSYPSTVVKLLAVVGHQLLLKPLKFLIQKGISSVLPKSITDKQTIWGNPEWSALGKYYSAFIRNFSLANLKEQFSGIDTKEILYGNGMMYDEWAASKGLLEFPGRSHGYIKSFIKNPEFQFAHEQQLSGAIGKMAEIGNQLKLEGLTDKERADLQKEYDKNDITNEDVMERINKLSLEHGKWAILMNDSKFVEKFQKYTKDNGAIGALIKSELPIVKIPINYVGRSFATKYGLIKAITGSKWYGGDLPSAFELIFKGTKNLTEDQANLLGKTLTIGTMGAAFFALGYMNRKKVKVNDDGSLDFLGMHISKNLIHSPEFESFFSGSETANKFSEEDNKKVSAWLEDFAQSDWDIAKKNPFANLLTYGFLPNVAITLLSKKDSDAKEQKLSTLLAQKIVNMGVPGFVKQPAQWMDTQEPGIHPMSAPVKRSPQGDMLDKFWQTFELAIPGLRKNVPESGDSGFSDEQLKEPHFEMLKEYGINPPKISSIKEYKVEEDEDHPKGQMSEEEGKIFKEERQQLIGDGIKNIYEKGIVLERKDFGKSPVLDLSNKEEVENFLIQNDISKEDFTNQLEGKIKSVVDKANEKAKEIAVPGQKKGLDLKSKVGN